MTPAIPCPVVEAFERQVDAGPQRPAVLVADDVADQEVRYHDLEERANALANLLLERRGPGAEPVALAVRDPALMLAALLGVLKAGRFYVPMNPGYPAARLRAMVDQVRPAVVVTDKQAQHELVELPGPERIGFDEVLGARSDRPTCLVAADALAYVLYTSGSTGAPKGVAQRRQDMWHNVLRHAALQVTPEDRVTLISSDGFVGAVSNVVIALLNGASLAPYSFRDDGAHGAVDWLDRLGITIYYSFPSFLRQVVAVTRDEQRASTVRLAYLGGEPVLPSDLITAGHLFPSAVRAVGLNSTETGLTRLYQLAPGDPVPDPVPVGGPVPGVEIAILGPDGEQVPAGEPGEIAVRGAYVRPLLWTGETPVEQGRPLAPGRFEFRTGDLGQTQADGTLIHRGRLDGMVKVRGFRVETAEVEAALAALAGVMEAAVVAYIPAPGQTELAAYVVPREGDLRLAEIRTQVATVLPQAMIPAAMVVVECLPRTANGKINRKALPAPTGPVTSGMAQAGDTAGRVARIWCAVLGVDRVACDDDFFSLGGTSISALSVISRVRKEFGVPVRLAVLFQTPTVDALADAVESLRSDAVRSSGP
jgi:acyl-coenzyme A synthetase/AMP-(fatty) acid ligase/acyl carrier protein